MQNRLAQRPNALKHVRARTSPLSGPEQDLKPRRWANALGALRATRDPFAETPWRATEHAPRPKSEVRGAKMRKDK